MTERESFLDTARKRFAAAQEAERKIRDEFIEDLRYVSGAQWPDVVKREREQSGRPCLTFNRLPTFVQQVANEARQNKPSIKFSPVDSGADLDTAKVFEGLARSIQYRSKADVSYETALEYAAAGGFGYFRLLTDYVREDSLDLDIKFSPIVDPLSVYGILIPACRKEKPRYAFVVRDLSEEEYKSEYPNTELASLSWDDARHLNDWVSAEKRYRVAEYWWVETTYETAFEGKRRIAKNTVKSCVTNGHEIIADTETEWPGDSIPIFCALGRVMMIDGEPQVFSLVRHMRHPQQLLNIYKSGIAEQIGLANRSPYIGYEGVFEGHEDQWRTVNLNNFAYLEVKPIILPGGGVAPFPQRQGTEPAIQALSQAAMQEVDDLKSIGGIFDASLGAEGNEKSGIAIQRRQAQSSITNLHFIDNLKRAQEEAGTALGYLIPKIYDAPREVRILGEDESETIMRVNDPAAVDQKTGKPAILTAGKYDVTVSTGPAYQTKRQETFDFLAQLTQANPAVFNLAGDIMLRNSDSAGADEMAERVKKFISLQTPGLIEDDKQQQQIPPQAQMQMQQMGQVIEQLTGKLNQLVEESQSKSLEIQSRMEIARMQEETKRTLADLQAKVELAKTEATLGNQAQIELLWAQLEGMKQELAARQHADKMQQSAAQMAQAEMHHGDEVSMRQTEMAASERERNDGNNEER